MDVRGIALCALSIFSAAILWKIWRLESIVASPSLSVRLRAQRCATFARASATAASDRKSGGLGKRGDLGGRRILKKKKGKEGLLETRDTLTTRSRV